MHLTITNKANQPVLKARIKHFSVHTTATESFRKRVFPSGVKPQAEVICVAYQTYLTDVEVLDKKALLDFEGNHRLVSSTSIEQTPDNRDYYVFIQPELRGDYSWHISQKLETKRSTK